MLSSKDYQNIYMFNKIEDINLFLSKKVDR